MTASTRLLVRSDRRPAIGRQNNAASDNAPAMNPINAPFAPSVCAKPATIGPPIMLAVMKKNVAAMMSATSRVIRRSL